MLKQIVLTLIIAAMAAVIPSQSWTQTAAPNPISLSAQGGATAIVWHTDLSAALRETRLSGKPVLLSFEADWCPYCRRMAQETFVNRQAALLMQDFVCVHVDGDTAYGRALMNDYGARVYPTLLILNATGTVVGRATGFQTAVQMTSLLRSNAPVRQRELRRFWFDYTFEPQPGMRLWTQVSADTWQEIYPNGQTTTFQVVGRSLVNGIAGTVVQCVSNPGFTVFIPDPGAPNSWLRFRNVGETEWKWLAQKQGE